eukprot:74894-Chlamydomonas_euryale.AAC.2
MALRGRRGRAAERCSVPPSPTTPQMLLHPVLQGDMHPPTVPVQAGNASSRLALQPAPLAACPLLHAHTSA